MLIYENPKTRPGIYQGKIGGFFIQVAIKNMTNFFAVRWNFSLDINPEIGRNMVIKKNVGSIFRTLQLDIIKVPLPCGLDNYDKKV